MSLRPFAALLLVTCLAPAASADETGPATPLTRSDLTLLPLDEADLARFQRDHADLVVRVEMILKRAERVEENLRERFKPDQAPDTGTRALLEERQRLAEQSLTLLPEIEERLAKAGLPAGALERARRAPKGPYRAERFGRALLLDFLQPVMIPVLPQRALFQRLVPHVDGAVLALHAEIERLKAATGSDAESRQALAQELEQRRREIERRFWRLVYWTLTEEQRFELGRRLPHDLQKRDDGIGHVYLVKGLTPSQGVAFKALLLEIEAEAAADTSAIKRAQDALASGTLPAEEKRAHERALQETQKRLVDIQLRIRDQGLALFTQEQVREIKALPPYLSGAERTRPVQETLREIPTTPDQQIAFAALGRRYAEAKQRFERGALDIQRRLKDAGPDSPEREMAEMMYAGLAGEGASALREAHGEVFLTILTPDQVEAWVLGLGTK